MEIDSDLYNSINGAQLRDAQELISRIRAAGVERAGLIVDVGCGSGNVTQLLSHSVPHDRIVAFDIDPDMVAFSKSQIKDDSIEFHQEDISKSWDKLSPVLQALEGQVSLVWSNRVLHWVREADRPTAAQNIYRLLAPGGRFFTNITYMPDVNKFLPPDQRETNEKLFKIPGLEEQEQNWKLIFEKTGLLGVTMEKLFKEWMYDDDKGWLLERDCVHFFRRYLPNEMSDEEKDKILRKAGYADLWLRTNFSPSDQPPKELSELEASSKRLSYYVQLRLTGLKPTL